jgi:hypothetical protein
MSQEGEQRGSQKQDSVITENTAANFRILKSHTAQAGNGDCGSQFDLASWTK